MIQSENDARESCFSKSSMSVVELNNLIVSMRPVVKRAKQQTIQKLVKQIKQYRGKKGSEEQLAANNKKADRLLMDVNYLKRLNIDKASKFSLGNTLTLDQASTKNNFELKVLTRVACHKKVVDKVAKWRQEHADWESLAEFVMTKNTGRRYKKKKPKTSSAVTDAILPSLAQGKTVTVTGTTDSVDRASDIGSREEAVDNEDNDDEEIEDTGSWNSEDEDVINDAPVMERLSGTSAPVEQTRTLSSSKLQTKSSGIGRKKDDVLVSSTCAESHGAAIISTATSAGKTGSSLPRRSAAIVKQISLDELSDEELFLPPPDEMEPDDATKEPKKRRKTKNSFFVGSDDEGESSDSESEEQGKSDADMEVEEEDMTEKTVRVADLKSSTKFAKSLSHCRTGLRPTGNCAANSRGRFGQRFKSDSGRQDGQKRNFEKGNDNRRFKGKPGFDASNRGKFQQKSGGRKNGNQRSSDDRQFEKRQGSFGDKRPAKFNKSSSLVNSVSKSKDMTAQTKPSSTQDEKLHPSWAASKERKQREKNVFVFQGTKKTFGDDD